MLNEAKLLERWAYDPKSFAVECCGWKDAGEKKEHPADIIMTRQQAEYFEVLGNLVKAKKWVYQYDNLSEEKQAEYVPPTEEERALARKYGIAVRAAKGVGKDGVGAITILWFLMCWYNSKSFMTAPKMEQIQSIIIPEVSKWLNKRDLNGNYKNVARDVIEVQTKKIFHKQAENPGKEWFVQGVVARADADPDSQKETLAGKHEDNMMFYITEASGVPDPVFSPIETTLTGAVNFVVMFYNPTRARGYAIETEKDLKHWECLHWDGIESPLVSDDAVQRAKEKYGEDSDYYRINIRGLPPRKSGGTVIGWEEVDISVSREIRDVPEYYPVKMGVDVGRGGDPSAIYVRKGGKPLYCKEVHNNDLTELQGECLRVMREYAVDVCFIDVNGLGWGLYDNICLISSICVPVNVSEKEKDTNFFQVRDRLWFNAKDAIRQPHYQTYDDMELMGELTTPKYKTLTDGKLKVESKDDMKKRGVKSPNMADAHNLTFFISDQVYMKYDPDGEEDDYDGEAPSSKTKEGWKTS